MRLLYFLIFALVLSSLSVLGQVVPNLQYSSEGSAVIDISYQKATILRNTGLQSNFEHEIQSIGQNEWRIKSCSEDSYRALSTEDKTALRSITIYSEAGSPDIPQKVDFQEGCMSFDVTAESGDRFRIGESSTVIEISNGTATFQVSPENQMCSYLSCQTSLIIKNTDVDDITFNKLDFNVTLQNGDKPSIVYLDERFAAFQNIVTCTANDNCSITGTLSVNKTRARTEDNISITLSQNQTARFLLEWREGQPLTQTKYDVGFTYNSVYYLLDPFFNTTNTTLSNGVFNSTFLNESGFVQINFTAGLSGTYLSEVFDAGANTTWNNISWVQDINYGRQFPNFPITEDFSNFAKPFTRNDTLVLFHFNQNFAAGENESLLIDFGSVGANLTCDQLNGECPTQVEGIYQTAYLFDGVDMVFVSTNFTKGDVGTDNFSVEVWVKTTQGGSNIRIVGKREGSTGFAVMKNGDNARFLIDGQAGGDTSSITGSTVINDGEWHHIVGIRDTGNQEIRLYVDGVQDATPVAESPTVNVSNSVQLAIGAKASGSNQFEGTIDEAAFFQGLLTDDEVLNHYSRGVGNITMHVRTCDDGLCSGESLLTIDNSTAILVLPDNRFFQYVTFFNANSTLNSPKFYNASIGFDLTLNTAPVCSQLNASPSTVLQGFITNLSAECIDAEFNLETVVIQVNGTNFSTTNDDGDIFFNLFNTSIISTGFHNFTFHATDSAGNSSATFAEFLVLPQVDSNPLVIDLVATPAAVNIGFFINFSANATDDVGLVLVFMTIEGINFTMDNVGGDIFFNTTNSSVFGLGTFDFSVTAIDTIGQQTTTTGSFTVREPDFFQVGECRESTGGVLLLWMLILISLAFITIGIIYKIGFIGFFGSIMLLITTWFIVGCVAFFAFVLALIALVLMIYFVSTFIGFKNEVFE